MVSYFHENLNKRIGAVAQTVYTDVYNCLRRRLPQTPTTRTSGGPPTAEITSQFHDSSKPRCSTTKNLQEGEVEEE